MAKIIDLSQQERIVPRMVGTAAPQLGAGPDDAGAKGLAMLGQAVERGADELYRAQKVEEDRVNTMMAEDAYNKALERKHELTFGDSGFSKLRGGAAVSRPLLTEYGKRFEDVERDIATTLKNDEQRMRFKARMGVARQSYQEDILRHLAREGDAYAKEVYDGTVAAAQRDSIARWDSPNDVQASLVRVQMAVAERAERYGWAPEYRDVTLRQEQGKIHAAVVQQAIAGGNYRYAQAWYNEHRADVDLPTAKMLEKAVEDGTQKEVTATYNAEYLVHENSGPALEDLRTRVLSDKALDENRRNMLVGRIQNRQYVLERRTEVEETRRLRTIERGIASLNDSTLAGFEPSAEQFAPLLAAAKGTELEPEVTRAMQLANQTRAFRNAPPLVQERLLSEAEGGIRTEPTKFDRRVVGAWRQIHDAQRRQVNEAPVSFAVQQGIVPPPAPLDLAEPAQAGEALAERFAIARGVAARYQAPFKPLTPEETTLLRSTLKGATVDQKRGYFSGLAQAAGDDYEGYSAIMAQLAPDDPVTAVAGTYSYRGRTAAADYMLRGQALLQPARKEDGKPDQGKLWPMPPELELRRGFQSYEQDAFAGHAEARNAMYQASVAIYAAKAAEEGDASGVINTGRMEESIRLATGGIEKYRGRAIVLPYGYEYSQFRDELGKRIATVVESGRMAPNVAERITDLPLESVGDGRYVFRAGDGILADKDGQPVLIDFTQSAPFRTSGDRMVPNDSPPTPAELEAARKPVAGRALARRRQPTRTAQK